MAAAAKTIYRDAGKRDAAVSSNSETDGGQVAPEKRRRGKPECLLRLGAYDIRLSEKEASKFMGRLEAIGLECFFNIRRRGRKPRVKVRSISKRI